MGDYHVKGYETEPDSTETTIRRVQLISGSSNTFFLFYGHPNSVR